MMQTVREPMFPEKRPPASPLSRTEPKPAVDVERRPNPVRSARRVRRATPTALAVLVLTALAITYVVVVVPAELAVLLAAWIGSMGLLISLPLLAIAAATWATDHRRPRSGPAPDDRTGPAGGRVA